MSKLITAARRAAFLRALSETGSLTLSAERARVNKNWSSWTRKRDAGFDADCLAAVAAAGAALEAERVARGMVPPTGWGSLDGVQLVVRGTPGRRMQIRRARVDGWSPAVETRFLGVLAATCNVKAACAAIRMTQASAYYHRRQWTGFLEAWNAAVEEGYMRLEMALIERAGNPFSTHMFLAADPPPALPTPPICVAPMRVEDAMHLIHMHQHAVRGIGKRPRPRQHKPSIEVVRADIQRKAEVMKHARGVDARVVKREAAERAGR